jgi:3-deoxy-D-manno-octulosonate 8-phosphate phosphatase (KDO 8-P phosphatase)
MVSPVVSEMPSELPSEVPGQLATGELVGRAARIALVLCDNDGVLTDGTVWVSGRGEEMMVYSRRDGMGVQRLRERGVATAIVTREQSAIVRRRAEKLELPHLWLGVRDKRAHLARVLAETGLRGDQLACIGDDVNDLDLIAAIGEAGLTAAPADAIPEVKRAVHYVCDAAGGRGAFREVAEWLLRLRDAAASGGDR